MMSPSNLPSIFVAIASYRDTECQWTVKDLFVRAAHPERIFVGICWQFDRELDHACFVEPYPRPTQVRTLDFTLSEAKGACWAKAQALSLARGEDYVLLIDAHMRFADGWDRELIATLRRTGNPRAFLSTYPAGYEPPDDRRFNTPRLAPAKFTHRLPAQESVLLDMPSPMPTYLVAGGFLFGPRAMFDEVPYDPHIYFHGEEITHAARLFTHGWDGYAPDKCLIHHFYTRKGASRHWDDDKAGWNSLDQRSYRRTRHLLNIERTGDPESLKEIDRYGLGSARSLAEFQRRIGVNPNAQLVDRGRYLTVEAITKAQAQPAIPRSQHVAASMTVCATKYGQMLVPTRDQYIGKSLLTYGEWTDGLNRAFELLIRPGDVVVEVGACYGARSLSLSRLAGAEGTLVAVEQSRRHVDLLHANAVLNAMDNLRIIHGKCGNQASAVEVYEPNYDGEGNFGVIGSRPWAGTGRSVPVIRIDDQAWGRVSCLFVDVPGEAAAILAGAEQTVRSHGPVVVFNADNEADTMAALQWLGAHEYHAWWYFVPFFVTDNFFGHAGNLFGQLSSACVIAVPDRRDLSSLGAIRAIGSATNRDVARGIWSRR